MGGSLMNDFSVEGFSLVYRGRGELVNRDVYLLKGGGVEFLLPLYFYRENLDFVFVYDLEGGYSLGERLGRGDGGFGVGDFVCILERVDFVSSEYFFDLSSFYLSPESIIYSMKDGGCGLVYCPLYRGDFWGSILSLFGSIFSGESWFGDYLDRLEALGSGFSISSFLSVVRFFGNGGGVGVFGSVGDCGGVRDDGYGDGHGCKGNSTGGFGGLLGGRGFGAAGTGSSREFSASGSDSGLFSFSSVMSGFDWWSFVVKFIGGGAGNVGYVVLLFLFIGFVMGLFI